MIENKIKICYYNEQLIQEVANMGKKVLKKIEKKKKRTLLYYDRFKRTAKHWNGSPITLFEFYDVKTGEKVILGDCFYSDEVEERLGYKFYFNITDAQKEHDILWNLSDGRISVVAETFEEVQNEYQRMLNEGISPSEINKSMMDFYSNKTRKLKQ